MSQKITSEITNLVGYLQTSKIGLKTRFTKILRIDSTKRCHKISQGLKKKFNQSSRSINTELMQTKQSGII